MTDHDYEYERAVDASRAATEFDDSGDTERDLLHRATMAQGFRHFDDLVRAADETKLRVAMMYLNSMLPGDQREAVVRILTSLPKEV